VTYADDIDLMAKTPREIIQAFKTLEVAARGTAGECGKN